MRKRRLKDLGMTLFIYKEDEKEKFEKAYDLKIGDDDVGMNCGNGVWIGKAEMWVCAHEVTHFVDWVCDEHLRIRGDRFCDTTELRAYLVGNLSEDVFKFVS